MTELDLARMLREQRDSIVGRFVADVRQKDLSPAGVSHSLLVDHIPGFLDDIVVELSRAQGLRLSGDAIDTSAAARRHGEQRWTVGYDLQALMREYGLLRHAILRTASEAGVAVSTDEFDVLARCLTVGISEAVTAYVEYRDAEVEAQRASLAFLAEAGQLLSSSLDYRFTLSRLTGLIVPQLADWCVVHVDGSDVDAMPIAHVNPAKVQSLRDLHRRYPLQGEEQGGEGHPPQTTEPKLVQDTDPAAMEALTHGPEHLAALRAAGFRSGIVVPLAIQGRTFGAMLLVYGDESGRRYGAGDVVFAGELARRAALAIDNARLYELSQSERSRVEVATRAKDEFVAVVSHELRTPLNSILGWLRLMRDGRLSESQREHALDVIERNAHAQSQLVADLLDISRVITGKVRLNLARVDLGKVVEMAVEGFGPAAEARGVALEVALEADGTTLRGDADRLQQVVWNLVSNAVKFTPRGGSVRVRVRHVASSLELTIEDTGIGIAPRFLPYVFETFRQSSAGASRQHGGLGIGLSITKHLVELHGGSVEARSQGPGLGATFVVKLPIAAVASSTPPPPNVPATTSEGLETKLVGDLGNLRVLVVDDEPDARELVALVLETSGVKVRTAAGASEALVALEELQPHVIVSDIGMPNEDGYMLIRRIRMLPGPLRNVPAIALTAFARNEDRARALVAGFNVHMAKPVEPSVLVRAVAALAGNARS